MPLSTNICAPESGAMIKRAGTLLCLGLLAASLLITGAAPAAAQGEPQIIASSALPNFPMELSFNLEASSGAAINDVRLQYSVVRDGFALVVSEIKPVYTPGQRVSVRWVMDMRQTGGLPPGTVVNYWWIINDAAGRRLESTPKPVVFNDARYQWKSVHKDNITLYWYEGNQSFGSLLLEKAGEGLSRLEEDTGAHLSSPVSIYVYANSNDVKGAMIYPQDWTGGAAYLPYATIIIGINQVNLAWGERAMVHELTHLVTHQMTRNPYGSLPNWLVEGLSMYAEGELESSFRITLVNALDSGDAISVRSLSSPFSANASESYLAYAQSFSLVDYLSAVHGQAKLAELQAVFGRGSDYDDAFMQVYGFDMEQLNTLWLAYAGQLYLGVGVG
jgi:hypothetical protein